MGIHDAIWQWRLTPSTSRPCVSNQNRRITDPDHCTHQSSPKMNTHTHHIRYQCTDALREHTNCSLRLSIKLFSFLSCLFVSSLAFFLHSIYSPSTCPMETPPPPSGDSRDQSVDARRYSLRLQKTLKPRDNVALPR